MTDHLRRATRALLAVSDKAGIVDFARALSGYGIELVSTGGTRKVLTEAGLTVREVAELTGFPEMMDGRVKTLHPKIHGGVLAIRDNPAHQAAIEAHAIAPIDLVVVNLYPFAAPVAAVETPPPPLPAYQQPPPPAPGYLWSPGYWYWDEDESDYYWVPGTWALPPRPGLLWTPGYWGWVAGAYIFHGGYWGTRVGFYGGVNYGYGYGGDGYDGNGDGVTRNPFGQSPAATGAAIPLEEYDFGTYNR